MSRRGRGTGAARRKTGWQVGFETALTTTTAAGKVLLEGFTYAAGVLDEGSTLVRIRGMLSSYANAGAIAEGWNWAVGIGITNNQAVAAGVASLPGPLTDADWEGWIWHHAGSVISLSASVTASDNQNFLIEVDSKAMRHYESAEDAFFAVFEAGTETGTITQYVRLHTRHLYLLP